MPCRRAAASRALKTVSPLLHQRGLGVHKEGHPVIIEGPHHCGEQNAVLVPPRVPEGVAS